MSTGHWGWEVMGVLKTAGWTGKNRPHLTAIKSWVHVHARASPYMSIGVKDQVFIFTWINRVKVAQILALFSDNLGPLVFVEKGNL